MTVVEKTLDLDNDFLICIITHLCANLQKYLNMNAPDRYLTAIIFRKEITET